MSEEQETPRVDGLMALIEEYGGTCYSTGDGCLDSCGEEYFPRIRAYLAKLVPGLCTKDREA